MNSHLEFNLLQKYIISLIILLLIMISFIYLVISKFSFQIYEPFRQISTGFNEISRGNFNVKLEIEESDLSDQFNQYHITFFDFS